MEDPIDKSVRTNPAISSKTGAAQTIGDDAQKNAVERVQAGTPPSALPIIERHDGDHKPRGSV